MFGWLLHPRHSNRKLLVAIYKQGRDIMASVAQLQATVAHITSEVGIVSTEVSAVAANVAGLKQTILDLQAQIGAGNPATQQQIDDLAAAATDIDTRLSAVDAALQPLATPSDAVPVEPLPSTQTTGFSNTPAGPTE
jgi:hypothetical protein